MKTLKIIVQAIVFPFQILFDPYSVKLFFDRYVNEYDSIILAKFNKILSFKTKWKFRNKKGLKINIGCGDGWYYRGWIGIDCKDAYPYRSKGESKGFDLNWNILNGLPFQDDSVKMIFISHFLEHLTYKESIKLLNECHRVLKPEGIIRIVVPDLDLYIKKFLEKDENFLKNVEITGGECLGNLTDNFLMNFYSNPVLNNTCHKYAYNFENLTYRFRQCGFRKITRSSYMNSQCKEFNNEAFDSLNSKVPLFSLYVEVIK